MSNFKVGDWVYCRGSTTLFKIETQEGVENANSRHGDIILWQPQVGEWVWQYPSQAIKGSDIPPNLVRYSHYYEGLICEPFIGEFPSFLKDNR